MWYGMCVLCVCVCACFVRDICVLYVCYLCVMCVLCKCYLRFIRVLCTCYVRAMCVLCVCYLRVSLVLCAWYVRSVRCYVPAKYVLSVCYLVTGRPILLYQTAFSRKLSQDSASLIYELSLALKQKNCMPCSSESSIFFFILTSRSEVGESCRSRRSCVSGTVADIHSGLILVVH